MKRVSTLFAVLCLLCQLSVAGPIDQARALKIASNFFGQGTTTRQLSMAYKAPYKASRTGKAEENLYYIFNRGNDQGYVVVAAETVSLLSSLSLIKEASQRVTYKRTLLSSGYMMSIAIR